MPDLMTPMQVHSWPMEAVQLVMRLEAAIREHRDQKSDDRCWLEDQKLYEVLGEPLPNAVLPDKETFIANCYRYHESRQNKTPYQSVDPKLETALKERDIFKQALSNLRAADKLMSWTGGGNGPSTLLMAARHEADVALEADAPGEKFFVEKKVRAIAKDYYQRNGTSVQFGRTRTDEEDAAESAHLLNTIIDENR